MKRTQLGTQCTITLHVATSHIGCALAEAAVEVLFEQLLSPQIRVDVFFQLLDWLFRACTSATTPWRAVFTNSVSTDDSIIYITFSFF